MPQKDFAIDNDTANTLVRLYQNGDQFAFNDLFDLVAPFIRKAARFAGTKTGIPAAEFESRFLESVWATAKDWDGRTNYMQRLRQRMDDRQTDVIRMDLSKKNEVNKVALSIDHQFGEGDHENGSFHDVVAAPGAEILPALIEAEMQGMAADAMLAFYDQNARYAQAVYAKVVKELDGEALAKELGFETYDTNARKLVSRAVKAFEAFGKDRFAA